MKKHFIIVLSLLAIVGIAAGALYGSGRNLKSLSDGMSHDFRFTAQRVVDARTLSEVRSAAELAHRAVRTDADAGVYEDIATYERMTKAVEVDSKVEGQLAEHKLDLKKHSKN